MRVKTFVTVTANYFLTAKENLHVSDLKQTRGALSKKTVRVEDAFSK